MNHTNTKATAITAIVVSLSSGCATVGGPQDEARRQLVLDLRKTCIEARGGTSMDAVGLYGGRLSTECSAWAYRRAARAGR